MRHPCSVSKRVEDEGMVYKFRSLVLSIFIAVMCLGAAPAFTATHSFVTKITRVLVDDENYAGCMIYTQTSVHTSLPACSPSYLTLDCTGELGTSKSIASQKLSNAQLAFITQKNVQLLVTDASKANGYCLAKWVTVLK